MVVLKPEMGIGFQEIGDFGSAKIKNQGTPVRMFTLAGISMFIEGAAVKETQAEIVFGKMSRNPVEDDADAGPDDRIFPTRKKLTSQSCHRIFEMFRKGIPIRQLAYIFGRSEPTIYRIINQVRQNIWKAKTIEYIYSPEFDLPSASQTILAALDIELHFKSDSTQHTETLTKEQEYALFRNIFEEGIRQLAD